MICLKVEDCLLHTLLCVQSEQCFRDMALAKDYVEVFAIFQANQYAGLVKGKDAARFPHRIFADLLSPHPPQPLLHDAPLELGLEQLQAENAEYLAVLDNSGMFLGAVSKDSLLYGISVTERNLRRQQQQLITQIETELKDSRIAATVFDTTSEAILVLDSHGRALLANRAFTKNTGYQLEEIRGKHHRFLDSGRYDTAFFKSISKAIMETGSWSGELWGRNKNGELYPNWLHINAIKDGNGGISHYVAIFSNILHLEHIQRHLRKLAYYDALTDLPNRQLFLDRISLAIAHSVRKGVGFSLLFLDLDGFKDVNDSLGHGFGDKILQEAATRLKSLVHGKDTVSRIGGDEFTVIVQERTRERSDTMLASAILESFSHPFDAEGHKIFLTASIGIAHYPEDGRDADTLMKNADAAMYLAKEDGRNRYRFFTTQLNVEISERLYLENALRESLREGGLYLMWQPQVRFSDGAIIGLEALARWRHSELGEIPPSRFIPLAEKAGLIQNFGSWILKAVSTDIALLASLRKDPPLRFAVNFSAVQIYDGDTLKREILETLTSAGIAPSNFVLEVTESIFMSRGHSADVVLAELGAWGIQIAIDDFGTGYSNLSYLKRFAVHHLKIDKSFIRDLPEDLTSRQLVTAIVQMAHSLNLRVIAEGVESAEQRDTLIALGCDEGQGYFFGKPMEINELLKAHFLDTSYLQTQIW